jgi:demethylmenaquinone methyltransferase/2-methoxy-6-polyprenyl-1,4-benzoquinol methylase
MAPAYDRLTAWAEPYRRRAVDALGLRPGETALEIGCGTGVNFGLMEDRIGPQGFLVGVDLCPTMLARAEARVDQAGWNNVTLVEAPAEAATIPAPADAVLFCATHDILRSPAALRTVLDQVPEGSRVVACGPKWVPWWTPAAPALNLWMWAANRPYVTTFEGFDRPWSHLASSLCCLQVQETAFGSLYLASGTVRRSHHAY